MRVERCPRFACRDTNMSTATKVRDQEEAHTILLAEKEEPLYRDCETRTQGRKYFTNCEVLTAPNRQQPLSIRLENKQSISSYTNQTGGKYYANW